MERKKLGFGLMRLPVLNPDDPGSIDYELTCKMFDAFLERGFTYFDTAWMYCGFNSERAVKTCLVDRHPRDSFTITTKLHSNFIKCEEDRDIIFNTQLEKTGAGYFDYYWLHAVSAESLKIYEKYDCFNWLLEKKASGLVKHIGFSFHDKAEVLDKILTEHPEFEYVQLQLNYLDWDSKTVQSHKCYDVAVKHNKPVVVMEPVKGGTLAKLPADAEAAYKEYAPDASIASWAVRFAASLPNVFMVLSGMSNLEQVLDNTSFMADFKPLNERERSLIGDAVRSIERTATIPCTACEYCMPGCPQQIAIPKYFSLYNAELLDADAGGHDARAAAYNELTASHGRASDCIECRQCVGVCPQHIPIVDFLTKVAGRFE